MPPAHVDFLTEPHTFSAKLALVAKMPLTPETAPGSLADVGAGPPFLVNRLVTWNTMGTSDVFRTVTGIWSDFGTIPQPF